MNMVESFDLFEYSEQFQAQILSNQIFLGVYNTPKKISSGVDNWYPDEFFEEFICGR
jgi:hypothetical protein